MVQNEGRDVKAVGYVRVSTEDQAREGYSMAAQESSIRAYCKAKGWEIGRIYRDEGLSAYKDVKRPGYEKLMAEMNDWNVVVVWKLNRLHRTMKGFIRDSLKLQESNKDMASVTESIDTSTALGKLIYHFLGALSEFESDQTSERVMASFDEKFKSDPTAWFTRAPLGYTLTRREEGGKKGGRLIINEAEAKIVHRIFDMVIEGVPLQRMPRILKNGGIRGKDGGKLEMVSLVHIIHNPVYGGYVYRNGVLRRNGHEAIIPIETFNQAQVALYSRTTRHHRYPLILGAERIECTMKATSGGHSARVYIPKVRPPELDELVMAETLRKARQK